MLYLQDLSVGQTFYSRSYLVTVDDIKTFAAQYDPQFFHLDETQAEESFFNGLAASGWHTSAIAMRLLVESVPIAGGLIGAGVDKLRWLQPVRPGDQLKLTSEIIAIRPSLSRPNIGIVKAKQVIANQSECPVQECIATMVVPVDPTRSK